MKIARLLPCVLVALTLTGCTLLWQRDKKIEPPANSVVVEGLDVRIELPKRVFSPGQKAQVKITARNTTSEPIAINATSGAMVFVRIWRHTGLGWDEVKRYPQSATMVMKSWTLGPGKERPFRLRVPVEPDWPTGEPLRLTAELNGRPDAAPGLSINVIAPERSAG